MNNIEEQDDELLALASIYEESFTCMSRNGASNDTRLGGGLSIQLDLPETFSLQLSPLNDEVQLYPISHLPPLYLHFTYPDNYPSVQPPSYILSCKWLNREQLSHLCCQLDLIWNENEGSVIMFQWAQYLKDNSLSDLNIHEYLDLSKVRPKRTSSVSINSNENCSDTPQEVNVEIDLKAQNIKYDERTIQDIAPNTNVFRLLREYDEEAKIKFFEKKMFECKVCYAEKSGANCIQFWPCHHVYCRECMKSYFLVQIKEGNIKFLRCPEEKCESEANPKQVQDLVPKDVFEKWDEMLLNSTLSSLGDVQPCPRTHCQYPTTIEDCQGQCPNCKFVFCGLCRFGYHGIEPCRMKAGEARDILNRYLKSDDAEREHLESRYGKKYLKKLEEEFLSMNYLSENSKDCPKCRAKIEKIDGCNKMTCQRCNNYFCWICMKMLDKAFPYEHFNNSKSTCYQKLFLGVDIDSEDDEFGYENWMIL